ncbi:hypothetical protein FB451DRAFT_1470874 [Mycena latifolia]|nr:hypothetical protein FB451DRAFT_1470874 [Mycena latifolia]
MQLLQCIKCQFTLGVRLARAVCHTARLLTVTLTARGPSKSPISETHAGTSNFGILDVPLPEQAVFVSQLLWGSIGWPRNSRPLTLILPLTTPHLALATRHPADVITVTLKTKGLLFVTLCLALIALHTCATPAYVYVGLQAHSGVVNAISSNMRRPFAHSDSLAATPPPRSNRPWGVGRCVRCSRPFDARSADPDSLSRSDALQWTRR